MSLYKQILRGATLFLSVRNTTHIPNGTSKNKEQEEMVSEPKQKEMGYADSFQALGGQQIHKNLFSTY